MYPLLRTVTLNTGVQVIDGVLYLGDRPLAVTVTGTDANLLRVV